MYMDSHAKINKFNSKFMQKLMKFFDNKENWASLTKDNIVHYYKDKKKYMYKSTNKYNLMFWLCETPCDSMWKQLSVEKSSY